MVTNFKIEVANFIKDLTFPAEVGQVAKSYNKPEQFTKLPAITYQQVHDEMNYDFRMIGKQSGVFQIDIWSKKQSEISKILKTIKGELFKNNIKYIFGRDLDDPSGLKRYTMQIELRG